MSCCPGGVAEKPPLTPISTQREQIVEFASSSGHGASSSGDGASSSRNPQSNALRVPPPQITPLNFYYAERWIRVFFDVHGIPYRIKLSKNNRRITEEDYNECNVTKYLEFKDGIFFVVFMMERDGHKFIARVDNAPEFNQQGFPAPGSPSSDITHILGREISIYRDEHTQQITSMRFTDRNICPTEAQFREYQITAKTYPFGSTGRSLRYYRLKNGYYMGIEVI
ncbi:uncharacterized protein LOC117177968 [Belonocnema kinseyi]|uniref:uncharacterized protein LOC117177968 n=1 Tax=Belonocnema kinseyi TaxID=2817044 RepID=UPI00143CFD65|nr:uncharacterized protein LOC117177968 [Belonocnema kinseyi]